MFFPIRSDRPTKRQPWVNPTLIMINILVFAGTYSQVEWFGQGGMPGATLEQERLIAPVINYYLWPDASLINLWQFLSYMFLHADLLHLVGNMAFLWVFGNSVEDRLGRVAYLMFYLTGGVLAGFAHIMGSEAPVIGASGAVAAVSGAYLALFPLSNITIVYFFFIIGSFEVAGMVLILFYIGMDLLMHLSGASRVAYVAHLAGYLTGFVVGMLLLYTRLLGREPYDMLSMMEHRRRRAQFQKLSRDGQPWLGKQGKGKPGKGQRSRHAEGNEGPAVEVSPQEQAVMDHRGRISEALENYQPDEAARLYTQLIEQHGRQAMPQQQQLDLANQLMTQQEHATAAAAYEALLETYPAYSDRAQVQLILGLIYARYLNEPERARPLLGEAMPRLSGPEQAQAREVLGELPKPAGE